MLQACDIVKKLLIGVIDTSHVFEFREQQPSPYDYCIRVQWVWCASETKQKLNLTSGVHQAQR